MQIQRNELENVNTDAWKKRMSILEIRKKFSTPRSSLKYLLEVRSNKEKSCFNPWCKAPIDKYFIPMRKRPGFMCRRCLSHFYPMVDSIFHRTHLPINIIMEIIFLMLSSRNSMAAKEAERQYAIGYPAIFRLMHQIRAWMGNSLNEPYVNTVVEIDESYISTGTKGLGRNFKFKKGRATTYSKNSNILCITERVGRASLFVIPSSDEESIIEIIDNYVDKSTLIITDEWRAYNILKDKHYVHLVVNHDPKKEDRVKNESRFKNGMASTNNGENIFSIIKRSVRGTYRKVTVPYLPLYLNEFAFRLNNRNEKDYGFENLLKTLTPLSNYYSDKFKESDYPKLY